MGQSCLASTGQPICHWAAAEWLHGGSLPPVASQVAREAAGHCAGRTGLLTALSSHQEMEPESAQLLHKRDIPDLGTPRGTWPPQKVGDREYCFHFGPSDHQAHTELLKYELFTPQSSASCSCLCGANSFLCLLPSLPAHLMKLTLSQKGIVTPWGPLRLAWPLCTPCHPCPLQAHAPLLKAFSHLGCVPAPRNPTGPTAHLVLQNSDLALCCHQCVKSPARGLLTGVTLA